MITQFTEHALFPITVYENNIPVDQEEFRVVKSMPFERMPSDNGFYTENKEILVLLPNNTLPVTVPPVLPGPVRLQHADLVLQFADDLL